MFSKQLYPIASIQQQARSTAAISQQLPALKPDVLNALTSFTYQLIEDITNPITILRLDEIKAKLAKNIKTDTNAFYQLRPASFTLSFYVESLCRHLLLFPADILHINIYLLRYLAKSSNDFLNELNINRLLLTATLVYMKYTDYDDQDQLPKGMNAYVAELCGILILLPFCRHIEEKQRV